MAFFSSKQCQVRHWQCHKPACEDFRKDSVHVSSSESSKYYKARHESDVPLSTECSGNVLFLNSSLPDDSPRTIENNKEGGAQESHRSSTFISYKNSVSKTECQEHGEQTCECNQQSSLTKGICLASSDQSKQARDNCKDTVSIFVKHNKIKRELCVPATENGQAILQAISDSVSIPVSKLKLVHKGKMATCENIQDMLFNKALFMAFGEISESEEGLEKADIDLVVKQLGVERNLVVRVLRKTGNVLDTIIEIGNM